MPDPTYKQAQGFVQSQLAHIERQVYERKYGSIQYRDLVPIDTSPRNWAERVTRYTMDKAGNADWFAIGASDVPRTDVSMSEQHVLVYSAATGYQWNLDEIMVAMALKRPLKAQKAAAARRSAEQFLDDLALRGNADRDIPGLLNASVVDKQDAVDGAGGESTWANKTGDEILKDVNDAIVKVYVDSLQNQIPDTVLLPLQQYALIGTKLFGDNKTQTVMNALMKFNVYTATTGRSLTIKGIRGLEQAGGTNKARMVVYRKSPDVLRFILPMPFQFRPVFQTASMVWTVDGIMRVAGLDVRLPKSMRYIDGI